MCAVALMTIAVSALRKLAMPATGQNRTCAARACRKLKFRDMNIQEIIFNIISKNPNLWIRYWVTKETTGLSFPGEYVEIRSGYISDAILGELLQNGFKIETIKTVKINADVYSDVLLKKSV